jgi:hypothetical protein
MVSGTIWKNKHSWVFHRHLKLRLSFGLVQLTLHQQLGNLLTLAEKLLAHVIFYKNSKIWKNKTSEISTYDFAFLRRRSRKLNCRKNFTNISSMESIYIVSILVCGMIQNSGDKVTWLGVGFYALRIFIFIRGLLQLVGLMGTKIDINVN